MGRPAKSSDSNQLLAACIRLEEETKLRHECHDGIPVEREASSPVHSVVASSILGELGIQLRGKRCQPHGSILRIRAQGSAFYPDVMVVCPPPKLDPELPNTLLNPRVIVEVLSPSTESYDRSFKWFHYQQIPELEDFILVSTDTRTVEHYHRQDDSSWLYQKLGEGDSLELSSIECSLPVATCFSRVELWEA